MADLVADAITADRFWVFSDPLIPGALDRWQRAQGDNPRTGTFGFPPHLQEQIRRSMAGS